VIRGSTIWRSIIDENCEIRNLELKKSLVGGHAKIQRGE
ncbi:MAG: NDP-sugar synthase, partial [Candidatus Heimdallarchaeaceae archaeon]